MLLRIEYDEWLLLWLGYPLYKYFRCCWSIRFNKTITIDKIINEIIIKIVIRILIKSLSNWFDTDFEWWLASLDDDDKRILWWWWLEKI